MWVEGKDDYLHSRTRELSRGNKSLSSAKASSAGPWIPHRASHSKALSVPTELLFVPSGLVVVSLVLNLMTLTNLGKHRLHHVILRWLQLLCEQ